MRNHLQFTKTDLVPRPVKGKVNLFVDRDGFLKSVDDTEAPKSVGAAISNVVPVNGVAATRTLDPDGDNNNLTATAKVAGPAGNSLTAEIAIVADSTALTVAQAGNNVVVTSGDKRRMIVEADFGDGVETVALIWGAVNFWSSHGGDSPPNDGYYLSITEDTDAVVSKQVDGLDVASFVLGSVTGTPWPDTLDWSESTPGGTAGNPLNVTVTASPATAGQAILLSQTALDVTIANAAGNDGTGALATVAQAPLTGGIDADLSPPHLRVDDGTLYIFDETLGEWRTLATSALA